MAEISTRWLKQVSAYGEIEWQDSTGIIRLCDSEQLADIFDIPLEAKSIRFVFSTNNAKGSKRMKYLVGSAVEIAGQYHFLFNSTAEFLKRHYRFYRNVRAEWSAKEEQDEPGVGYAV